MSGNVALAFDQALLREQVEEWQRAFVNYYTIRRDDSTATMDLLTEALQVADNLASPFSVRATMWARLTPQVMFRMDAYHTDVTLHLRYADGTPDWVFNVKRAAHDLSRYLEPRK